MYSVPCHACIWCKFLTERCTQIKIEQCYLLPLLHVQRNFQESRFRGLLGWFFKLSGLRSLVRNNIPFMAVTATATRKRKDTNIPALRLRKFVEVSESLNKPNIAFRGQTMVKQNSIIQYFNWILDELKEKRCLTDRTLIYCQTVKQCSTLYSLFVQELVQ